MKYIFNNDNDDYEVGESPIKDFSLCFYDMDRGGGCFDECTIQPEDFDVETLTYIDTEENEGDTDRTRLFLNHINGNIYELRLHKLSQDEIDNSNKFNKDT